MFTRFSRVVCFAAASAFAYVAQKLPQDFIIAPYFYDPQPQSAKVVVQDTSAWLVSEFVGRIGCAEITMDSIVPLGSTFAAHWNLLQPKLDSASSAGCLKVARFRRVDALPVVMTKASPGSVIVRRVIVPDSVTFSFRGPSVTLPVQQVKTPFSTSDQCLVGALPPFKSHEDAVSYLKDRAASSQLFLRLNQQIRYTINYASKIQGVDTAVVVPNNDLAIRCIEPLQAKPFWLLQSPWPDYLSGLASWNDPRVPREYALPSPGNAADLYGEESLDYFIDTLKFQSDENPIYRSLTPWSYSTGKKGYFYRGSAIQTYRCGGPVGIGPQVSFDTLATDGQNLLVTNEQPTCPRQDVDAFAGSYTTWLAMMPRTGEPLNVVFRHYASAETSWSWPMEADSILVRGQKVALSEIQGLSGIVRKAGAMTGFKAGLIGRSLSVQLDQSADLRMMDASGRILTSKPLPQGRSLVAIPQGARGLLLLQAGSNRQTIVVP